MNGQDAGGDQGVAAAALFIANLMGLDLSLGQQLIVCATAMIASLGAPGIPSAGMVTMIMVLQSVGLPAEAIAVLADVLAYRPHMDAPPSK